MSKTVGELIDDLSCFNRGTPVNVTVCPIDGELQNLVDVFSSSEGVIIEVEDREIVKKDPLHRLNSIIIDYCLSRDFDKRFPDMHSWFDVQVLCKGQKYRAICIQPLVDDSFLKLNCIEAETTEIMFNKAIAYYEQLLNINKERKDV